MHKARIAVQDSDKSEPQHVGLTALQQRCARILRETLSPFGWAFSFFSSLCSAKVQTPTALGTERSGWFYYHTREKIGLKVTAVQSPPGPEGLKDSLIIKSKNLVPKETRDHGPRGELVSSVPSDRKVRQAARRDRL
ncbi:MAG: hypothetical protein M2R45_00544 [Verrucomicrobia subdivision 3 bacterium]|nr:hypothetical protein [Limisphaerales bacterium]MCS1413578.1 hypothetical protein [Limisphaerales bacterium]